MATLAIRGHVTRGKEIIEILEKYPYKVGDKVKTKIPSDNTIYVIRKMEWEKDDVIYTISPIDNPAILCYDTANSIIRYTEQKEESMEEKIDKNIEKYNNKIFRCYFDSVTERIQVIPNKDYELKEMNGDYFFIKKQPQYPKTCEECCKVLGIHTSNGLLHDDSRVILAYKIRLVACLQELLICRDAYWKIAGNWKPDWDNTDEDKYVIEVIRNKITLNGYPWNETNHLLAFPTEEMRDAFYENFKDLIEECKELL